MRSRVLWSLVPGVSADAAVLVSRVKQSIKTGNRPLFLECLMSEDEGATVFRNVGNRSPNTRTLRLNNTAVRTSNIVATYLFKVTTVWFGT